jgi:hypothetical protein
VKHAIGVVEGWERTQKAAALEDQPQVVVAGVASFWDIFPQDRLNRVRKELPDLSSWV